MNEIQIFDNAEFGKLRTVVTNSGQLLFCGKDVADALGYKRAADAISAHCKGVAEIPTPSNGGVQKMKYINEGDVYRLTFRSKLPSAERFTDWVADEVLPKIRKTGSYSDSEKSRRIAVQEINANARLTKARTEQARVLMELLTVDTLSETYRSILVAKSAEMLTGEAILPIPQIEEKTYSATEIGDILGVSPQKIGRLSNQYSVKTSEYGGWYKDITPKTHKEVDTFRYNSKAIDRFRELLANESEPCLVSTQSYKTPH